MILRHIIYIIGAKFSAQRERFLFRCLPIAFTFLTDVRSRLENFFENPKMFVRTRRIQF